MITNIIEIELLPADRVVTRPVHQWDIGQIITVTDAEIEDGTPVDFGNRFMQGGLRAYMLNNQVTIPAPALQQERDLTAYVVVTDENSETTVKEIRIPVIPRPKPEDYVDEEIRESTEFQYVLWAVEEVEANVEAAAEAAGKAAESETAAGNAATAAGNSATAAAGSATSASGSAKAAAASEKNASGAATTATNKATEAGNSAAAAQNAKTAAEQAKTAAEAARDAAKTSEENAKTHQGSAEEAATKAALIEANIEEAYHEISNLENQMTWYYKGAETKASEASGSAESALASKNAAAESETNAGQSAKNAAASETAAKAAQAAAEAARDKAQEIAGGDYVTSVELEAAGKTMTEKINGIVLKCSEVGMTTDDANGNNFELLCEAISKSNKVIVDGMYPLTTNKSYKVDKNVRLVGDGANCGFTFPTKAGLLFTLGDNCYQLELLNLMVENPHSSILVLFSKENYTTTRMKSIHVSGCNLRGNVSPVRLKQNTSVNPAVVDIGVDYILIEKNVSTNNRSTCFVFSDTSYDRLDVIGNVIRNFDNLFVSSAVTNEAEYLTEILASKKMFSVTENDVECDDDWFHTSPTSSYYAFVLAEGVNAIYSNNRVVGMKSKTPIPLYDAYISCSDVVCENNYWKNNCVLTEEYYPSNVLMKAKENGGVTFGQRRYYNNTFITEESFYAKYGMTDKECSVGMIDNVAPMFWDVQNNYFDLYHMRGFMSSAHMNKLIFKNNTVHAKKWTAGSLTAGVADGEIICENNSVFLEDGVSFKGVETGENTLKTIIFRNNLFNNCRYILGSSNAKELVIAENIFRDSQNVNCQLASYGTYGNVVGCNNKIDKKNGDFAVFNGIVESSIDYTIESTTVDAFSNRPFMQISETSNFELLLEFDGIEVLKGSKNTFRGFVNLTIKNGLVGYTDSAGAEQIVRINTGGDACEIPATMQDGENLPFSIVLTLEKNFSVLAITNKNNSRIVMKTRILSVGEGVIYIPDPAGLPAEYQQVMYVEALGKQYIDTGVLASDHPDGIKYTLNCNISANEAEQYTFIFGALANGSRSFNLGYTPPNYAQNNRVLNVGIGGTTQAALYWDKEFFGQLVEIVAFGTSTKAKEAEMYVNGEKALVDPYLIDKVTDQAMPTANIYFLRVNGSSHGHSTQGKIYRFAMETSDGTPLRNFVPCYRVADDVVGFYDTVNGKFYENAGTGTFSKGVNV